MPVGLPLLQQPGLGPKDCQDSYDKSDRIESKLRRIDPTTTRLRRIP